MQQPQKSKLLTALHILLIVIGLYVLVHFTSSIYSLWKRGDIISEREKQLQRLEEEQNKLKTELSYTLRPEFIEEEARNKLNLVLPGETLVILPEATISGESVQLPQKSIEIENQQEPKGRVLYEWVDLFLGR